MKYFVKEKDNLLSMTGKALSEHLLYNLAVSNADFQIDATNDQLIFSIVQSKKLRATSERYLNLLDLAFFLDRNEQAEIENTLKSLLTK